MTRFILHVGDGKCGSSSIQSSLFAARPQLRALGILYESHHPPSGNFCFGTLIGGRTRGDDAEQRRHALDTVAALRAQSDAASHVLLSSETFLWQSPAAILTILDQIAPDVSGVDVIAYVRDPADMYLSLAQQSIKASYRFAAPTAYRRPLDEALGRWSDCPGVQSVTVRLFDPRSLTGGDVVRDMAAYLSAQTGQDVTLPDIRDNESLSAEQMVALQHYRRTHARDREGKATPGSMALIDLFVGMNAGGMIGTPPMLKPRVAAIVRGNNAVILAHLRDRYGLTDMADTLPEPTDAPDNGTDWSAIATILAQVDRGLADIFKRLVREGGADTRETALRELIAWAPDRAAMLEQVARRYWG